MTSELPEVRDPRDDRSVGIRRRDIIERVGLGLVFVMLDDEVDFGNLEAGDGEVELRRDFEQSFELDREDFRIPAGLLCQPIIGNDIGALFGRALRGLDLREERGRTTTLRSSSGLRSQK